MKRKCMYQVMTFLILIVSFSCFRSTDIDEDTAGEGKPKTIVKKRNDGTLSSVNQVDEEGRVNGVRVTYYADGKTIHSKFTFSHGIKQGPSVRYYENGQVFEHAGFKDGEKNGLTRKYYKNGTLLSECEYMNGKVLPGLKEYDMDGEMITSYPEIQFTKIDHLVTRDRIDLEISCVEKNRGVKYYLLKQENGKPNRTYLISENSTTLMQFYVKPGETLNRSIEILAEIPTALGNVMAKELSYQLKATNKK
jgi:antitoxin component YwqK of YwqJK toxin-antitoxin module